MGQSIQESQIVSDIITISAATHEIDCSSYASNSINLILHINIAATTISVINANVNIKLSLMIVSDIIGATATFGAGFEMSSNNPTPLTGVGDMNTYQFMGEASNICQVGIMGKILV